MRLQGVRVGGRIACLHPIWLTDNTNYNDDIKFFCWNKKEMQTLACVCCWFESFALKERRKLLKLLKLLSCCGETGQEEKSGWALLRQTSRKRRWKKSAAAGRTANPMTKLVVCIDAIVNFTALPQFRFHRPALFRIIHTRIGTLQQRII